MKKGLTMMVMAIFFLAGCTVPDFLTFKKQPNAPTEEQEQKHEVEQVPEEEPIHSPLSFPAEMQSSDSLFNYRPLYFISFSANGKELRVFQEAWSY